MVILDAKLNNFYAFKNFHINLTYPKKIVDSCSLFMSIGKKVHLTEGNRENIKVTTIEDYINLLSLLSIEDQKQIFLLQEKEEKR